MLERKLVGGGQSISVMGIKEGTDGITTGCSMQLMNHETTSETNMLYVHIVIFFKRVI